MTITPVHTSEDRMRRKLEKRDRRIAGLERQLRIANESLSLRTEGIVLVDTYTLRRDIARAVQEALCNVRMIPVLGIGGSDRIVGIEAKKPEGK